MAATAVALALLLAATSAHGGVVLDDGILTSGRPIWDLVRASDALRAFLQHSASAVGGLAVVLDAGSAPALQRARDAVADLRRADVNATGPFVLATFHRGGVSEPRVLRSWPELQKAVADITVMDAPRASEARSTAPGPLDAVLGAAAVAPRGTRIVVVTEHGAQGSDGEAAAVAGVGRALSQAGIQVGVDADPEGCLADDEGNENAVCRVCPQLDAWTLGECGGYRALANASLSTGGSVGCGELWGPASDAPGQGTAPGLKEVTLAVRRGLRSPLEVNVDRSVVALQAVVRGEATLRAPSGHSWALSPDTAVDGVSSLSLDRRQLLDATGAAAASAPWRLTPFGDAVDVEVRGLSPLTVAATLVAPTAARYQSAGRAEKLRLREPQGVAISSVKLLDASGKPLAEATRASEYNATRQVARRAAPAGKGELEGEESEWDVQSLPGKPSLVETTGQKSNGEVLTRVSSLTKADNILIVLPLLDIELNANTQLFVRQGQSLQMSYDVTNNRDVPQLLHFRMRDEQAFLLSVRPFEAIVPPQQTIQVVGNLIINQNAADGQTDKVTFAARSVTFGQQETTKTAIIYVQQEQINDIYTPNIWATWKSTCTGAWDQATCSTNSWTIDFTIQDKDSGLLTIVSYPRGIQFRQEFVSGTRELVKAYYSASCCSKKVDIVATDLRGNSNRQSYDVGTQFLSPGEIAGISMGVIAILLIIVIIVLAILLCRRKQSLRLERRLSSRLAAREAR